MPIFRWLPQYRASWLWKDAFAGVTLAAYAIPVAMAYAALAGLAPQAGVYCFVFSGVVYAIFATSRHLAIGPTAAISMMSASVLGALAGGDTAVYASMAAMTAALVAVICTIAWIFRLSTFVNFISASILLGFKAGAALSIAVMQLPALFGIAGGGSNFFEQLWILMNQVPGANPVVLFLGVGALLVILMGQRLFPGLPISLAVVVASIGAVKFFGLSSYGVKIVGHIPSGIPALGLPTVGFHRLESLFELAFACFLLSYVESMASAKTFAEKHKYSIDPRQELLGLGAANLASAFGHGFPVAGGLSQSAVNDQAGAQTPLALVFASCALSLVLIFLTASFRNLPEAVLASIVLASVVGFIKPAEFKKLRRISRFEFHVAVVAFIGVLCFGILKGVTISAVASILFLLRMLAKPHVAVLGRIPGTMRFSDASRHSDNEFFPGLYIFRVEAPLLYFNTDVVFESVFNGIRRAAFPVQLIVCDLSTSPYVDASGAQMLAKLEETLENDGIHFRVVEAHAEVRKILRATGISERLGGVNRRTALADLVEEFERGQWHSTPPSESVSIASGASVTFLPDFCSANENSTTSEVPPN